MTEKEFEKIMQFVGLIMVFKSRLVTMNGGDNLPNKLQTWLDGLLENAAQQMNITSIEQVTESLKKALLVSKPLSEQVCFEC
jgi:hypothetical protein